jgi:hypothetical protein
MVEINGHHINEFTKIMLEIKSEGEGVELVSEASWLERQIRHFQFAICNFQFSAGRDIHPERIFCTYKSKFFSALKKMSEASFSLASLAILALRLCEFFAPLRFLIISTCSSRCPLRLPLLCALCGKK